MRCVLTIWGNRKKYVNVFQVINQFWKKKIFGKLFRNCRKMKPNMKRILTLIDNWVSENSYVFKLEDLYIKGKRCNF